MFIGTTLSLSIKGCLALCKSTNFSLLRIGVIPLISMPKWALAKIKSMLAIKFKSLSNSVV